VTLYSFLDRLLTTNLSSLHHPSIESCLILALTSTRSLKW
jgi:hypothetical protein